MRVRPWRIFRVTVVVILLVTAAGGPATPALGQSTPDDDRTVVFDIQLEADGNAVWTVSMTVPIKNESDRAAFQELANAFEGGEDVAFSADVFRRAAAAASRATGRTMAVHGVVRNATVVDRPDAPSEGRLQLRFRWTNFARVDGDRLHVGDAFNTTNGTWLPSLAAGQVLVIRPPPGHNVVSAPTGPRAGVLRWEGPVRFEPGYLSITYERGGLGFPIRLLVGAGAVILAIALGVVIWRRRDRVPLPMPAGPAEEASDQSDADGPPPGREVTDDELISDEELVERLLAENGGRMKQARIVKETGWSNAKVSQLLSTMDDAGRIDKLRIGRENLISLPDEDVGRIE